MFTTSYVNNGLAQELSVSIPFSDEKRFDGFGPVVSITAAGRPASFVVDTGSAPTFVVAGSSIGKNKKLCESGININLNLSYSRRVSCGLISGIPEFTTAKLSGLLSPQSLATDSLVVVDLLTRQFSLGKLEAKSSELEFKRMFPDRTFVRAIRVGSSIGIILVKARLGSREEVLVDIDTGSPYTYFSKKYIGKATLSGAYTSTNVTGQISTSSGLVTPEPVLLENYTLSSAKVQVWDEPHSAAGITYDGAIGRDFLSRCAIGIAPHQERAIFFACK